MSDFGSDCTMDSLQIKLKYRKSDADDWTKVEDRTLRKKIQDRLAKRKSSISHTPPSKELD